MNPTTLLKKPIVLIVIGILLAILFLPFITSGTIFDNFSTDSKVTKLGGVETAVYFSKTNYAGTWRTGALSESFTITSKVWHHLVRTENMESYRYALYIDGKNDPIKYYPANDEWLDMPNVLIGQWVWLEPWNNEGLPNIISSTLRIIVVMEWKNDAFFSPITHDNPDTASTDGAIFKSGNAEIGLPINDQGPFEEGSKVNIVVRTGYDTDNSWAIKVYPPSDRTDLVQSGVVIKTLSNDVQTTVPWIVPTGAFKSGSTNAWIVEMWNTYFNYKWTQILTIDQLDRAAIITNVDAANNGNSMEYTVSCEKTYADLNKIIVYAWYGSGQGMPDMSDAQSWIIYGQSFPITGTTATFTVTAKPGIDGNVMVKIVAYDVDMRPSKPDWQAFMDLGDEIDVVPPPLDQPFILTTTALIIAVMVVLAIFAIMYFAPLPPATKALLVMIIGIAGAILVWMAGKLMMGV